MKTLFRLAGLVVMCFGPALFAQQTCNINPFSVTVAITPPTSSGVSSYYDNRSLQCASWQARYFSEGISLTAVSIQGAPDVNGTPGSWADITASGPCTVNNNPSSVTPSSTILVGNCYYPWIRIAYAYTGSGSFTARAGGSGGLLADSANGGGGGSGLAITGLSGDGTATGPGNVPLTLATVNSGPGACGDATHVCAVTTNGKGLVTAQAATAITFPGGGINQLTGDATAGPGTGSQALTFATVNAGPGICGDATHVCQVTTNDKGLTTSQTPVAITYPSIPSVIQSIGAAFSGGGSAMTAGSTPWQSLQYLPVIQVTCTVLNWQVSASDGTGGPPGTVGFRVWRVAGGTALPTVANTITTADLALSANTTMVPSTSFANFTGGVAPTFSAGDNIAIQLNAAGTATGAVFTMGCQ